MLFQLKRTSPPGSAPGTLPKRADADRPPRPVRMRLVRYDADVLHEVDLLSPEAIDDGPRIGTAWLDLEGHDVGLFAELGTRLGLHPLAVEDVVNTGQRPKVEEYGDSLFVIVHHLTLEEDPATGWIDLDREQIALVLQPGTVMSVREHERPLFDPVRQRLRGGARRIRTSGPDYLGYALIDAVVDHYFPLLEDLGDRLDALEDSVLEEPTPADLARLHALRRILLVLRKSVWPLRDTLNQLLRSDVPLITDETRVFLRDVADHAALALDMVETYRDWVASLTDLYMTGISNRMNEIMKVLTIIATIFIPLSFVAGLYGMNFDTSSPWNMPELGWRLGYPAVLAVMAAMAGGLLVYFRRKHWI